MHFRLGGTSQNAVSLTNYRIQAPRLRVGFLNAQQASACSKRQITYILYGVTKKVTSATTCWYGCIYTPVPFMRPTAAGEVYCAPERVRRVRILPVRGLRSDPDLLVHGKPV